MAKDRQDSQTKRTEKLIIGFVQARPMAYIHCLVGIFYYAIWILKVMELAHCSLFCPREIEIQIPQQTLGCFFLLRVVGCFFFLPVGLTWTHLL